MRIQTMCGAVMFCLLSISVMAAPFPGVEIGNAKPGQGKTAAEYNQSGNDWYAKGEYDKAVADYTEAIRLNPKYDTAYCKRGAVYCRKGDYDRGIADYSEAIRLNQKNDSAYTLRGIIYLMVKKEYDQSIADFTEAIRLNPQNGIAYLKRGIAYQEKGDNDRAIFDLTEAIRIDPQDVESYSNRGNIYSERGDFDKALSDYGEVIRLNPKNDKAYAFRGSIYFYAKKEFDQAISDFTEAIRLNPKVSLSFKVRGEAYVKKADYDRAISDFTEAIKLDPQYEEAYKNRISAFIQLGDADRAIIDLTEIIRFNSGNAEAYSLRGALYLVAKEDSTQAIKDLTEAIRLNPRIDKSYSARGAAYSSKGEYDQAIVDLTEAIRLNPENSSAYNIRAFAWGKKGHYQKAIADANETIRLDPKFASAYQHRGYAYLKQTNLTQAIEDCTKAIQFDSENGRAYATRGQAYAAQGKRELALADYRKALEVNRKEAEEEGIPALLAALERRDTQPPTLEVRSPVVMRGQGVGTNTKTTVSTGRVTVAGIASDESGVAEVTVNGVPVKLDAQGNFSTEVALKTGDNQIMVTALDRQGNSTRRDLTVVRQESVSTSPISSGGKYYALVIGINQYVNLPRLKTAVMDAQEVAAVLGRDYGFETRLLLDQAATKDAILTALNDYRKQTRPGDTLLIYYAGHGEFDREVDKGYWIPVEARDDENVRWVSADDVTTNLKGMAAQHILVVSDSCYSGTIRDSQSSLRPADHNRYLVKMQEGRSRMVMSSGGKEPVADGGGGGHSIFAKAFLNGLKEMEADQFTAEELFGEFVKIQVTGGSDQIPEFNPLRNSGHEKGGLVFVRKPSSR